MKLQGDVRVDPERVVVVDHVQRQLLLALARVLVRPLGVGVPLDVEPPPVQHGYLALGQARQDLPDGLVRVAAAPAELPGQVVARAEGQSADRRCRRHADLIEDREDPADGAVAAAGQDPQVRHLLEQLEPGVI